jgi:arabinoxylan arabinofuranohydrolase
MPILLPMTWTADGWPVTGYDNHTTPFTVEGLAPHAPIVASGVVESDEFNFWNRPRSRSRFGSQPQNGLRLCWQWNHVPDAAGWSLTDRRGWLRLKPTTTAQNIREARNTLTQRTFGPRCSGETLLDYSGLNDGDVAGLSCFQNRYGFVGVKKEQGQFFVVMQRAMQKGDANGQEIERIPLASLSPQPSSLSPQIYLCFDANFENRTDKAIFFYSLDGEHWTPIGDTLQMYYDWPDFCGYRFALFHYATQQTGGRADFDFFHVN